MTAEDEELQILTNVIGDGWPETLAQAREFAFELQQIRHGEDVSVTPVRLERLREMTAEDEELQILTNVIGDG